ncbi:MAG: glycosyltransferase [Planctomycetota bacterium]
MLGPDHQKAGDATSDATPGTVRVAAVVPTWNRPADISKLLIDLTHLDRTGIDLRLVIVDNGSAPPIDAHDSVREAMTALEPALAIEIVRLDENAGGSGGFNAGIRAALAAEQASDHLWLIDSDARVGPGCLRALVETATAHGPVAAVGAAIIAPGTDTPFETGGTLDQASGRLVAMAPPGDRPIEVDYAAACCLLVPTDAVAAGGLLPDLFLHSDDVAFCLRLREATGRPILATPKARCQHPRFDRFKTWARYYEARNWIVPAQIAGLGVRARLRRAWREVVLAVGQTLVGRDDLARLHVIGLIDAAAGRMAGRPDQARLAVGRTWPAHRLLTTLDAIAPTIPASAQPIAVIHQDAPLTPSAAITLTKSLEKHGLSVSRKALPTGKRSIEALSGLLRVPFTPPAAIAIVNAKAPPHAWCDGRIVLAISPIGFTVSRMRTLDRLAALLNITWRGTAAAVRIALRPPAPPASPTLDDTRTLAPPPPSARAPAKANPAAGGTSGEPAGPPADLPTLSVIILTRNRAGQLVRTLARLYEDEIASRAEIIVVDNGSTDGTPTTLRERFPGVMLVKTGENLGVEGFNRGVKASSGEVVLILDDDAWPVPGALAAALGRMADRPEFAAVMLHRRHPRTKRWEWPFEHTVAPGDSLGAWPDMGSGNLVRRDAWDAVGGYEAGYFLYRNDTDLALTLLASGREVAFAADCYVWHDSPIAKTKSRAWLRRSTRNWVWLCKRHGQRGSGVRGAVLGWLWAHRLAGLSPTKHASTLRGFLEGLAGPPPPLPRGVTPDGSALKRLIRLKLTHRERG